jgi:uncharacterized phage protein gp47/JayE
MADIIKTYTKEQYFDMQKNYVIAQNVGLTNYNKGSDTRAIIETVADIASMLGLDFLEGLRQAIPIMLYKPLNFERKAASVSTGNLRFYRLPVLYITYTGSDSSVKLDITALQLTLTTSGTPSDDVTVDFATYNTIAAVVAEIDSKTNWTSVQIQNGAVNDLYLYSNKEIVANTNYLLFNDTVDVMYLSAPLVVISAGVQASVDNKIFFTTVGSTIPVGDATSPDIASSSIQKGLDANIDALAIDTINGNGIINTPVAGVEHVINDAAFSNGSDEETDEERAARFQAFINGLHGGTKLGIESNTLDIDGIKGVTLRERYPQDGYNTVVADDGTGSLSATLINEIDKMLIGDISDFENYPGKGVAGIKYNIEGPTRATIDITGVLTRIGQTSDEDEMKAFTKTSLENYINTLKLGGDVIFAELIALGKKAHTATYDFEITVLKKNTISQPLDNISISDSEVARTGTGTTGVVTLTVNTLTALP